MPRDTNHCEAIINADLSTLMLAVRFNWPNKKLKPLHEVTASLVL